MREDVARYVDGSRPDNLTDEGPSALSAGAQVREVGAQEVGRVLHRGRVLVVTDDPDAADFLTASLALEGYDIERCDGPGASRDCPRLHGVSCTLRERADVAVVDLDCDEDALICSKVPEDGGTVFVRRSSVPPVGRRGLSLAVDGARRHVESLRGAQVEQRTVMALELD